MMKRLRAWLGVALIFFFGVICGLVISAGAVQDKLRQFVTGGPDQVIDAIVARLKGDLKLDHSQQEMLQQIVVETRIKLSGIRQKTQPEVDAAMLDAEQKVRGILNPQQVKRFDEIVRKSHEKWKGGEAATPEAK